MGKRGPQPRGRVDTHWRPDLAYAIGLITADGSLSNNGRHISFTSKDRELAEIYRTCLELTDIAVGQKQNGSRNGTPYYVVQFGDVLFYRFLETIGLHANKSKTLGPLAIPDEYFFDFLRGEWDGDGTIHCSEDKRWRNSFVVSLGFASGSRTFLEWLQTSISSRLGTRGYITSVNRGYQLRYAKGDSQQIHAALFYRPGLPCLSRKFAKAEKIFTMA